MYKTMNTININLSWENYATNLSKYNLESKLFLVKTYTSLKTKNQEKMYELYGKAV